ncbi:MAG: AAA family ATPase, partial [Rhodospirillaceae bacterium]
MIKRTFRGILHLVGGLAAGLVLVVMLIAWQFSQGPIPLGFLSPYIEAALNKGERDITLKMGEPILTWAGWDRALDIRVLDLRMVDNAGGVIGRIPEVAFSISGGALIEGRLAPKSIDLFGPVLRLRRDRDGRIDVGFGATESGAGAVGMEIIDTLLDRTRGSDALGYLTRLSIIGGDITVVDQALDRSWRMPAADVHLTRFIDRLKGDMSLMLKTDEGETALKVGAEYLKQTRRLDLNVAFERLSPATFADLTRELAPLGGLEVPFSGTLLLGLPVGGAVDRVRIKAAGGPGRLNLPKPAAQSLNVAAVDLDAAYDGAKGAGQVAALRVRLAPNSFVALPAPVAHRMPVRGFTLKGSFTSGGADWQIDDLDVDLGGPRFKANGRIAHVGDDSQPLRLKVGAQLTDVQVDRVTEVWPKALGADAYAWVTSHISKGVVPRVAFQGAFELTPDGALRVDALSGTMNVKDTVVDYLSPLPAVQVDDARMEFDDLVGQWKLGKGGEMTWVDGPLTQAMRLGHIFILNDADRADPGQLVGLHDILEGRPLLVDRTNEIVKP